MGRRSFLKQKITRYQPPQIVADFRYDNPPNFAQTGKA